MVEFFLTGIVESIWDTITSFLDDLATVVVAIIIVISVVKWLKN